MSKELKEKEERMEEESKQRLTFKKERYLLSTGGAVFEIKTGERNQTSFLNK